MDSIGAEVGQKMRSAIKAKLMELDCYVDDELPDYIMVMVANRRSKSQMNEDLNLFLSSKTSTFVNWLHIVLKKLKEVTVTNPEVYKKATKRKSTEVPPDDKNNLKVKKEKSSKKIKKETDSQELNEEKPQVKEDLGSKSLTDDLPIITNKLGEKRRVILSNDDNQSVLNETIAEDNFDIPLLSEVTDSSNEKELQDIERKIRNVKSRLGILIDSDEETNNLNSEQGNLSKEERNTLACSRQISILESEITDSRNELDGPSSVRNVLNKERDVLLQDSIQSVANQSDVHNKNRDESITEKKPLHKRITFENDAEDVSSSSKIKNVRERYNDDYYEKFGDRSATPNKRPSVLDRLGKRAFSVERTGGIRKRINLAEYRKEEEKYMGYHSEDRRRRSSSREKDKSDKYINRQRDRSRSDSRERSPYKSKDKARELRKEGILGRLGVQSKISVIKKPELSQKSDEEDDKIIREVPSLIKVKPRVIPTDIPQPNKNLLLKAVAEAQRSIAQTPKVGNNIKPDALFTKKYKEKLAEGQEQKDSSSFRKLDEKEKSKLKILIQQSTSKMSNRLQQSSDEYNSEGEYIPKPLKNVERCKYWPNCRQGDKCEFVHPSQNCEVFPHCKFGEKCLFLHPRCKFGSSCTKRDCPYDHNKTSSSNKSSVVSPTIQNCKFFPNCTNLNCPFYHPKPCKYGKYCKNISDCSFSHNFVTSKRSLSWRSN